MVCPITGAESYVWKTAKSMKAVDLRAAQWEGGCNIASLTESAVSSTFSSTLRYALIEERHFALVDGLRFPTWARFNRLGSATQSDPTISSMPNCDHDHLFELPWSWERDAQSLRR